MIIKINYFKLRFTFYYYNHVITTSSSVRYVHMYKLAHTDQTPWTYFMTFQHYTSAQF